MKNRAQNAAVTEGYESKTRPLGTEIQTFVKAELEMMLAAPIFAQSNRCKSFLSYVVQQTLAGNTEQLKERTIGINVFERANDYDTGDDSIVRVTANDVRKRIGQFYRESQVAHSIQIELPRGAYIPAFIIHPIRRNSEAEEDVAAPALSEVLSSEGGTRTAETPTALNAPSDQPGSGQSQLPTTVATSRKSGLQLVLRFTLPLLLVASIATLGIWKSRTEKKTPQVWDSFLQAKTPILLCLGAHDLHFSNVASSPQSDKFSDLVLHKQIISIDDAAVVSSMASALGKRGIAFRVVGAERTSLSDFRLQPVILIGAMGNKWALRLTQNLPYRIEITRPYGEDKEPVAAIIDANQPSANPWKIDFSVPIAAWKSDYAIVAKMDDVTTGVPVLIEAGLGNDGSLAASEFLTGGLLSAKLAEDASCRGKSNFEAVVGTEIIDTKSGPPHILRLSCW